MDHHLYLGIKGAVVCIDKHHGKELWQTHLKNTSGITNLVTDDRRIYAYSGGHLFALDRASGTLLWENELKGLGYGPCIIAGDGGAVTSLANQQAVGAVVASSAAADSSSD